MLKRKRIKTYKYSWMKIKSNSPIDINQIMEIFKIVDESMYFESYGYYSTNNIPRTIYHALGNNISKVIFKNKRCILYPTKFKVFIKLIWEDV